MTDLTNAGGPISAFEGRSRVRLAIPFSFILIGIPFLILAKIALCAGAVWYGVRLIVGVVHLSSDRPYPHPWTLMA